MAVTLCGVVALLAYLTRPVALPTLPEPFLAPTTAHAPHVVNRAWDFLRRHAPGLTQGASVIVTIAPPVTPDIAAIRPGADFIAWTAPNIPDAVFLNVARMAERSEAQIVGDIAHELEHRRQLRHESWIDAFWRVWQNRNRPYLERSHEIGAKAVGDAYEALAASAR